MARWVAWIGHAVVAVMVVAVGAPLRWLPWPAALALGRCYGYAGFLLYPQGRRAGQINLRHVYGPALSRGAARRRTVRVFGSLGQALAESLQFSRRFANGSPGWDRLFDIEDPPLHQRVVSDPRPKVFVTAHLGSWEMSLIAAGLRMGQGAALMRRVDNPFVERLLRWARLSRAPLIDKRGGAAEAIAQLQQGDNVALLLDENAGYKGAWVDFLGRPASTHRTAALLSARTGSPIVVGAAVRRPGGRYLYRLECIEPASQPESIDAVTQQITAILERWIREDPLQWRWIHWRWKTRPDGTEETYTRRDLAACFTPAAAVRTDTEPLTDETRRVS
jgi:KDO2-lipid IV(A) lauroyltransferase